jgi:Na+(H+)/acetate symporter ActP
MLRLMLRRVMSSRVVVVAYVVVGVLVANSHHYFAHLSGLKSFASALLAVVLWPLVLLGISFHLK